MRNCGMPLTEYYLTIELSSQVKCLNNDQSTWHLPYSSFIKLITFNRSYDSILIDYKIQKLERLLQRSAPVELVSGPFDMSKPAVVSSLISYRYIITLRDAIGQIFDVRKHDLFDKNIYLNGKSTSSNCKNINDITHGTLIWTSYSLKLYQRPYISNMYWENLPKFRLIKTIPFIGNPRKVDLSKEVMSDMATNFPKTLFDSFI